MVFWIVGYLALGAASILCAVLCGMFLIPHVCDYVLDDWIDLFADYMEICAENQSKGDRIVGVLITALAWPLSIGLYNYVVIPRLVRLYNDYSGSED